jgi:predicted TIM-barrel fold metal-dependent hydrolase
MVATASTIDEAKENELLLKNNDIPAMVKQRPNEFGEGTHYAVLVPEDMADEAHVIIESQDAYDDFYDLGLNDESEDDLEGEILGD